ncbi:MAG: hypothetical protein Q8880_04585 [Bacteroidota bacterium]|nr:hypothetical protein [Bacteroidota bacterium]
MAKNKSIFQVTGAMGPVTFFELEGEYFAKRTTSLDKNKILTDPNFQRTRENMSEFGAAGHTAKSFRNAFAAVIRSMTDARMTGRLTAELRSIVLLADGVRGQRPLNISEHKEKLVGFEFNNHDHFSKICNAPLTLSITPDRTGSTLTINPFNPVNNLTIPQNATHFRIVNALGVVSDEQYDSTSRKYYPVDAINNAIGAVTYSDYIPVDTSVIAPVIITATLPGAPVLPANVSVINAIGIEFSQEINLQYYLFAQGNAMMVKVVG